MSDVDVSKIEDETLRKDIEDLQNSKATYEQKIDELTKAVEELTSERDELKKTEDPKPMEKEIEDLPDHLQKAFNESREAVAKMEEEVAKIQKEALTKELLVKADEVELVIKEDEKQMFVDSMTKLDGETRDMVFAMLENAQSVVKANGDLFKEMGSNSPSNEDSAEAQINKLANELMIKSDNVSHISVARDEVRKAHPKLAKLEREEN